MDSWRLLLSVLLFAGISIAVLPSRLLDQQFKTFKVTHGKNYGHAREERYRFNLYLENKMKIAEHNERFARGEVPYKLGVNAFSDETEEELQQRLGLLSVKSAQAIVVIKETIDDDLPASIDWRTKGAVTSVKDQGRCGSCWAFSAVGALESQRFIKTGKLEDLSVQQMVDCSDRNYGCNGGFPGLAFEFVERMGGLAVENDYRPYNATAVDCSDASPGQRGVGDGYVAFRKGDENALKKAVASYGPISVAFTVLNDFFNYKKGIYSCNEDLSINHAVLLVGYDTDPVHGDYWILKNSWGTTWGDDGYFKMARNKNNTCQIATLTSAPIVWQDNE